MRHDDSSTPTSPLSDGPLLYLQCECGCNILLHPAQWPMRERAELEELPTCPACSVLQLQAPIEWWPRTDPAVQS